MNGAWQRLGLAVLLGATFCAHAVAAWPEARGALREINPPVAADQFGGVAILGATLVDGRGGPPVSNSVVIVRGEKIVSVGSWPATGIPADVQVFDAKGLTLVPGLMDSHFHIERDYELPRVFLAHGVTSVRDPGQWVRIYEPIRTSNLPQPRCFVAGPHLDTPPHAYPRDAFSVTNADDVRRAVNRFVNEGASHIKAYYRLPLELIRVACEAAHQRGVPVTAHLELVDADEAIRAGLDGIEHITSFGTALAEKADAGKFREDVRQDNEARRPGRYELWSKLDLDHSPRVQPLIDLIVKHKIFLSPTLAVFERRADAAVAGLSAERGTGENAGGETVPRSAFPVPRSEGVTDVEARGFANMLKFVRLCHRAGATIVVGSHSSVPKAERGWAYQREMELLAECGLTPREILTAATLNNARFFHADARLGSIEPGKLADLVLIDGDPLSDIKAMRRVKRVMLNGQWTDAKPPGAGDVTPSPPKPPSPEGSVAAEGIGGRGIDSTVFPGKTWEMRSPEEVGLSSNKLAEFSALVGGRGCVVRNGYMVFAWGDQTKSSDVASAFKPLLSTLMLMAVQEGKISSVDEPVAKFEPRLQSLNDGKDAAITWRHLASQTSGYGLTEKPGEAYSYNDYALTLYYDTLMDKVFRTNATEVLRSRLAVPLQFEDSYTFFAFGTNDRPGRLALSCRDFARVGLLYLRGGQWRSAPAGQLLQPEFVRLAISSPISSDTPLSRGLDAEMLPRQRTMGGKKNITPVGPGYYSFNWWLNTTNRAGERMFVAAPPDTYVASGHGGRRVLAIIPSLDLIACWNDSRIDDHDQSPGNPNTRNNRAFQALLETSDVK